MYIVRFNIYNEIIKSAYTYTYRNLRSCFAHRLTIQRKFEMTPLQLTQLISEKGVDNDTS